MVTKEQIIKAKERALAQGVQLWELEPGHRYVAPSCTNDGMAYEVVIQSVEPGDIPCTCPGATYRGICKHIGAIMLRLEADQVQVNDHLEVNNNIPAVDVVAGQHVVLQVNDHLAGDIADLYYR
jgi:uncharacterized Zn finger protein